jgi:hypothetical protein
MIRAIIAAFILFQLSSSSLAKPSFSFGDAPRACKSHADCAVIIVSCHNCDWADSVNKKNLEESKKTVKAYCEEWRKNPNREKDCPTVAPVKKREAVCENGLCTAHTFFGKN